VTNVTKFYLKYIANKCIVVMGQKKNNTSPEFSQASDYRNNLWTFFKISKMVRGF
jgi:hypothetical protein